MIPSVLTISSPDQNVFDTTLPIIPNDVKPAECADITVVDIRIGDGDNQNNLIIARSGYSTIMDLKFFSSF